jgi:hypothetical protein
MFINRYAYQIVLLMTCLISADLLCSEMPKSCLLQKLGFVYAFVMKMMPQSLWRTQLSSMTNPQIVDEAPVITLDWKTWLEQCEKIPYFSELNKKYPLIEKKTDSDEIVYNLNFKKQCELIQKKNRTAMVICEFNIYCV